MNFRLFIYYSSLCGAWAAFFIWLIVVATGLHDMDAKLLKAVLIAGLLGAVVGAAVGCVDALLNHVGAQRFGRTLLCALIGLVGGLLGGLLGQGLYEISTFLLSLSWMLVGAFIGVSVGLFDLIHAMQSKRDVQMPLNKTLNGVYGGLLGGLIGGLLFGWLSSMSALKDSTSLALGLVILGACIGLMIGLAQVFFKEAWVRIEVGRRAGREMILSKDKTTIGRAETCDLGLFGEQGVEKTHARIILEMNHYYVEDAGTPGGTFVNDVQVARRAPLKTGDAIRVGSAVLRFGERQQRP